MATKQTYVVWAPPADPKADVIDRRTKARPDHLKNIERLTSEGILSAYCVLLRGSLLNDNRAGRPDDRSGIGRTRRELARPRSGEPRGRA
jgi:hypothetical protein